MPPQRTRRSTSVFSPVESSASTQAVDSSGQRGFASYVAMVCSDYAQASPMWTVFSLSASVRIFSAWLFGRLIFCSFAWSSRFITVIVLSSVSTITKVRLGRTRMQYRFARSLDWVGLRRGRSRRLGHSGGG